MLDQEIEIDNRSPASSLNINWTRVFEAGFFWERITRLIRGIRLINQIDLDKIRFQIRD